MARLQAALGPQYRIEHELGRGGMGVVFLATDTTLDRPVAIKVIHPELATHASITRRFSAEARMIARLRHPNIVAIHLAGEATGLFYYVMDYVPGESLRHRLNREGRLAPDVARGIVADLASALDAAGRAGLVHRDVKPENVLLDSATGRAMLADFGIARAMAADGATQITGQGIAVGTPTYMSPEQAAGDAVDSRSDLYALGVVAYEMLAGAPPFRGPNAAAVASMQISEPPVPIERLRPDAAGPLARAIMRALAKNPADRWQTGEEFRRALHAETPGAAPRRGRGRRVATAAALALAALSGTAIVATSRTGGPPAGVNPRHSILVLPFDNLRQDPATDWLREGAVHMLGLNLAQWNDLSVVDHERVHDLLRRHRLDPGSDIGLDMARTLAREAGAWTVVLGDFAAAGDSLHLSARVFDVATGKRVDLVRIEDRLAPDVRPMFDRMAEQILDLSGAPGGARPGLAQTTTASLEAYRAYLNGVERLNRWELADAERHFRRAVAIDTTFGLAYFKLSLARGWVSGADDSLGVEAIRKAARYAARLPVHDQTMIRAYLAFTEGDFATARSMYRRLLSRDSTDADAWYGLGDVDFHDTTSARRAELLTASLRAFRRALELDPTYYLALDHTSAMLTSAARSDPPFALLPGDSFAPVHGPDGRRRLDSVQVAQAVQRARAAAVAAARSWVASQPETPRAYTALIEAYVASEDYPAALQQLTQMRRTPGTAARPDLPFIEARVRLEAGDVAGSRATLVRALDSTRPGDFRAGVLPHTALGDVLGAANVFAYAGDLENAERTIDLADGVRRALQMPDGHTEVPAPDRDWRRVMLGHLYSATGAPVDRLRRLWQATADAARSAPPTKRAEIVEGGWIAALGLFLSPAGDASALGELQALGGGVPPKEVLALLALGRRDSTQARRLIREADTITHPPVGKGTPIYWKAYRRPLSAQVHYELGDYQRTIDLLRDFQPERFLTDGLDPRWGLLGRVRLLRAAAYERLGRRDAAREEYRQVIDQWEGADPALQPFLRQARAGLARVSGEG
ncbi:MAG TPA: serine/threonine-protein kinase [Gemmatimonadales bacterium]|nr:serine/threonine-protein kinase [Gemmatimonadales bacterium]